MPKIIDGRPINNLYSKIYNYYKMLCFSMNTSSKPAVLKQYTITKI